jgi:LPS-assembly protein
VTHRNAKRSRRFWPAAACVAPLLALALGAYAATAEQAPILLQADEVTYDTRTGIVTAAGNVEVSDEMRRLYADRMTYNEATNVVTASGNVRLIEPNGDVAFADAVELTGDLREGALQGFSALIGEHGRLAAVSGSRSAGRYTEARGAAFTPCAICPDDGNDEPLWQVKAVRVVHDQERKELSFESARLEFFGMPLLYLPVFSYPDPTVRHRSGLLVPVLGSSTELGTFIQAPYYISLSPSRDLTLQPFLTTDAGDVLQAEYRERWERGGYWLQGSLGYEDVRAGSEWLSHLFGSGRTPLTETWRAGFDVQLTSNDTYLRRYDISYVDRLTSDLFVDAVSGRNRAEVTSFYFQGLRAGDSPGNMPLVLPLAEYTFIPEDRIYDGRLQVDASALVLVRSEGQDMVRASASADWLRQSILDNGQVISVDAFARTDLYYVRDARVPTPPDARDDHTLGRILGYAAGEWRWPFVRKTEFYDATLVVEPIAQIVAATGGGNPPGIPNEDSTTYEFDETNLFVPNEFPGLDLWTGGPRSNIGVRATAFFPGGTVEGILGQEFRTRRDPTFAPGSGVGGERSDIVGRITIQFPGRIDLVHRFRIDPVTSTLRRNEVYATASYGRSSLNLSYLKLSPETTDPSLGPREQVAAAATLGFYGNWAVFAGLRQDLELDRLIEGEAGFRYDDECFTMQVGFLHRETSDRDLRPTSSLILRIGLKTGLPGSAL